ncbi:hypothetical protein ABPG74_007759 [Tetrahymena malaccensis]
MSQNCHDHPLKRLYVEFIQKYQRPINPDIINILDQRQNNLRLSKQDLFSPPTSRSLAKELEEDALDIQSVCILLENGIDNLFELEISGFKMNVEIIHQITQSIKDNVYLQKLSLSNNMIDDNSAAHIAMFIQLNQNIKQIDLSYNRISNFGAQQIAQILSTNKVITHLTLSRNYIEEDYFGEALKKNQSLLVLDISHNNYSMESVENLLKGLLENQKLQKLKILGMLVGHIHIYQFCEVLSTNSSLQEIDWDLNLKQDDQEIISKLEDSLFDNNTLISMVSNKMNIATNNLLTEVICKYLLANEWIFKNYKSVLRNEMPQCHENIRDIVCRKITNIQASHKLQEETDALRLIQNAKEEIMQKQQDIQIQHMIVDQFQQSHQELFNSFNSNNVNNLNTSNGNFSSVNNNNNNREKQLKILQPKTKQIQQSQQINPNISNNQIGGAVVTGGNLEYSREFLNNVSIKKQQNQYYQQNQLPFQNNSQNSLKRLDLIAMQLPSQILNNTTQEQDNSAIQNLNINLNSVNSQQFLNKSFNNSNNLASNNNNNANNNRYAQSLEPTTEGPLLSDVQQYQSVIMQNPTNYNTLNQQQQNLLYNQMQDQASQLQFQTSQKNQWNMPLQNLPQQSRNYYNGEEDFTQDQEFQSQQKSDRLITGEKEEIEGRIYERIKDIIKQEMAKTMEQYMNGQNSYIDQNKYSELNNQIKKPLNLQIESTNTNSQNDFNSNYCIKSIKSEERLNQICENNRETGTQNESIISNRNQLDFVDVQSRLNDLEEKVNQVSLFYEETNNQMNYKLQEIVENVEKLVDQKQSMKELIEQRVNQVKESWQNECINAMNMHLSQIYNPNLIEEVKNSLEKVIKEQNKFQDEQKEMGRKINSSNKDIDDLKQLVDLVDSLKKSVKILEKKTDKKDAEVNEKLCDFGEKVKQIEKIQQESNSMVEKYTEELNKKFKELKRNCVKKDEQLFKSRIEFDEHISELKSSIEEALKKLVEERLFQLETAFNINGGFKTYLNNLQTKLEKVESSLYGQQQLQESKQISESQNNYQSKISCCNSNNLPQKYSNKENLYKCQEDVSAQKKKYSASFHQNIEQKTTEKVNQTVNQYMQRQENADEKDFYMQRCSSSLKQQQQQSSSKKQDLPLTLSDLNAQSIVQSGLKIQHHNRQKSIQEVREDVSDKLNKYKESKRLFEEGQKIKQYSSMFLDIDQNEKCEIIFVTNMQQNNSQTKLKFEQNGIGTSTSFDKHMGQLKFNSQDHVELNEINIKKHDTEIMDQSLKRDQQVCFNTEQKDGEIQISIYNQSINNNNSLETSIKPIDKDKKKTLAQLRIQRIKFSRQLSQDQLNFQKEESFNKTTQPLSQFVNNGNKNKKEPLKIMLALNLLVSVKSFYRQVTKNTRIFQRLTEEQHEIIDLPTFSPNGLLKTLWDLLNAFLINLRNFVDFGKLIVLLCTICHVFCSFWHYIAIYEIQLGHDQTWLHKYYLLEASVFTRYVYSFYFLAVTMITVGYGDITPQNSTEIIFTILTMFVTGMTWGFSISKIGNIIDNIEKKEKSYKESMQVIHTLMREENIRSDFRDQISNYLKYIYNESNVVQKQQEQKVIEKLSNQLRFQLISEIQGQYLENIPFIKTMELKQKIIFLMEQCLYSPGEIIFQQNSIDDCALFYIVKGEVEIIKQSNSRNREDSIIQVLQKSSYFGEISFITGQTRNLTAKAADFCRIYKINREKFLNLIRESDKDYEDYIMIRDNIIFKNNYSIINQKCFQCQSEEHFSITCPKTHLIISKKCIANRYCFSIPHLKRQIFSRRSKELKWKTWLSQKKLYQAVYQINDNEEFFELLNEIEQQAKQEKSLNYENDDTFESSESNLEDENQDFVQQNKQEDQQKMQRRNGLRKVKIKEINETIQEMDLSSTHNAGQSSNSTLNNQNNANNNQSNEMISAIITVTESIDQAVKIMKKQRKLSNSSSKITQYNRQDQPGSFNKISNTLYQTQNKIPQQNNEKNLNTENSYFMLQNFDKGQIFKYYYPKYNYTQILKLIKKKMQSSVVVEKNARNRKSIKHHSKLPEFKQSNFSPFQKYQLNA